MLNDQYVTLEIVNALLQNQAEAYRSSFQSMLVDVKEEIRSIKMELTDFKVSLQFTQKRVVRAISFEHFTAPSMPIFSDLKILKVHDLFQLKMLSFVYDCIKKIAPPYFHSFFELVDSVHQYSTQQVTNNDIFLTQMNTLQYGLRTVCYFGAKCWNDIPVEIKKSPSANNF